MRPPDRRLQPAAFGAAMGFRFPALLLLLLLLTTACDSPPLGGALAEVYFSHARLAAYVALTMCVIGFTIGGPPAAG